jgi:hypothetical protein
METRFHDYHGVHNFCRTQSAQSLVDECSERGKYRIVERRINIWLAVTALPERDIQKVILFNFISIKSKLGERNSDNDFDQDTQTIITTMLLKVVENYMGRKSRFL